jgi:hypothetical protein
MKTSEPIIRSVSTAESSSPKTKNLLTAALHLKTQLSSKRGLQTSQKRLIKGNTTSHLALGTKERGNNHVLNPDTASTSAAKFDASNYVSWNGAADFKVHPGVYKALPILYDSGSTDNMINK